ncbi:cation transporter [Trichococcus palustris]|uniref:Cation transporter n=1 Tax=Trichococcus palustris TaxID=140314 RepID=A0A143YJU5_9LACT|nr:potassium transporter TrkG [Trichococcus palustris]CZQ88916.1 cation transporter [Trichococcus palustris]SFL00477.1 trk system potassium uptake protein TrkH [Trichococcus palustris]
MLKRISNWSISQKIAISFAFVIFTGSLLLTLPISQLPTSEATYLDNLFTSVSMVCVTGLFTQSVYESYTIFGQIVGMALMQIGGLGLMTLIASVITRFKKRIGLRNRLAVQEGINRGDARGFREYLSDILKYTAVIEGTGFLLMSFRFVPLYGWGRGLFTSLFLSISAFCNAGFDNLGNVSLVDYVHDPLVNFVITSLIILGGIGFSVWFDVTKSIKCFSAKKGKRSLRIFFRSLSLHSRLALLVTVTVIAVGMLFFVAVEYNNPDSIGTFTFPQKLLAGYFQTVTMRTAGFATIDYTTVYPFTLFWFVITMFIGGSPGGTAGGLKTTTFAIVVLMLYNEVRGQSNVNIAHHTIDKQLVRQALVIFMALLGTLILGASLLSILNPEVNFIYVLFESISALATVGVSANLTPTLGRLSQAVLMFLMFAGRIGPITLVDSLAKSDQKVPDVEFSKGNILIG